MPDPLALLRKYIPEPWALALALAFAVISAVRIIRRVRHSWFAIIDEELILNTRLLFWILMLVHLFSGYTVWRSGDNTDELAISDAFGSTIVILAIYAVAELALYTWKRHARHTTNFSIDYLKKCASLLLSRQDAGGGIRVKAGDDAPVQPWSSAQAAHGLVVAINDGGLQRNVDGVLKYIEDTVPLDDKDWLCGMQSGLVESAWIVLSLEHLISSTYFGNLAGPVQETWKKRVRRALGRLVAYQLPAGGWTPLGSKVDEDLRTLPTIIAMWAFAGAFRVQLQLGASEADLEKWNQCVKRAIEFLKTNYIESDGVWDANPNRGLKRKNSALSMLTYGILAVLERSLEKLEDVATIHATTQALSRWLNSIHPLVMKHIDHCLARDINDNEVDDPFDNIVQDRSGKEKQVPITYYDWITSALMALKISDITGRYQTNDVLREQQIVKELSADLNRLDEWYTFRIAMILVVYPLDGSEPFSL